MISPCYALSDFPVSDEAVQYRSMADFLRLNISIFMGHGIDANRGLFV